MLLHCLLQLLQQFFSGKPIPSHQLHNDAAAAAAAAAAAGGGGGALSRLLSQGVELIAKDGILATNQAGSNTLHRLKM
jgi:hypothetical protein